MNRQRVLSKLVAVAFATVLAVPAFAQGTPVLPIADARARVAVEREIAQAAARGLPVRPLIAKAMEGIAKQASGERIQAAVASKARRLGQAQSLLAPSPSEVELIAGADALEVGVPAPMLKQVRAAWPDGRSVAMPLDVLTELVARGVPPRSALEQITNLMSRGATPTQIASLGASVQADVAAGLTPDAALEVRARGVMQLLPSPATQVRITPRDPRP